ncbi:MAG: asparagine synthase C-terminal domain-containing protein [Segetibacter sp.]
MELLINYKVADNPDFNDFILDGNNSDIENLLVEDYKKYMVDDVLVKVDRASMSCSLEGREPLLDHRIAEWVAKLPLVYKYNNGTKKYILKKIVHQYLPEKLMNRPKMGFGVPIKEWFIKDLKYLLDEYINDRELSHLLFNKHFVLKLKHDFLNDKEVNFNKIWIILVFQMWYKKWM